MKRESAWLIGLADAIWAFGTLEIPCPKLLAFIEDVICGQDPSSTNSPIREFTAVDLCNTAWALARLGFSGRAQVMQTLVWPHFSWFLRDVATDDGYFKKTTNVG